MKSVAENATNHLHKGRLYGVSAALLFGASTPLSKLLLPRVSPLMLAALLYLGAAWLLTIFRRLSVVRERQSTEARIRASDAPALSGVVAFGGVLGPVLMLFGLSRISALTGSLLLNLEAVFTIVLAVVIFHEHLDGGSKIASVFIILGAGLSSYQPGIVTGSFLGVMTIVAACLCWAIDNNLSQRLSVRDPLAIAQIKTAGAGLTSLVLALATGYVLPPRAFLVGALALGSLSYGASLVCVMLALRYLGAAREAAWFSTAPFIGALLSVAIFRALPNVPEALGIVLMVVGVFLLTRERHAHVHTHQPIEHDHIHFHDDHHDHFHAESENMETHSHTHRHQPVTHEHVHVSDVHHRHRHRDST